MKYYVNGKPVRESTSTQKETEARRFLKEREGRVASGQPVQPRVDRVLYENAAADLRDYYRTTGKRNMVEAECRLKHLDAFFTGWRIASIGPSEVTKYVRQRQEAGATNAVRLLLTAAYFVLLAAILIAVDYALYKRNTVRSSWHSAQAPSIAWTFGCVTAKLGRRLRTSSCVMPTSFEMQMRQ